jgi:two-component system response regulator TctD
MRLLLAEDNRELAHWLEKALVQGGFAVDCVFDGRAADHLLQSEKYALAVLDIGMPGLDGLEVVQRLRKRGQTLPSCCHRPQRGGGSGERAERRRR